MPQLNTWWERAKCKDVDPEIFAPKPMYGAAARLGRDWSRARATCHGCPVQKDCLEYTLAAPPPGDVGGYDYLFAAGFTPDELMKIRRKRGQYR